MLKQFNRSKKYESFTSNFNFKLAVRKKLKTAKLNTETSEATLIL